AVVRRDSYRRGAMTQVGLTLMSTPGYILDKIEALHGDIESMEADLQAAMTRSGCPFERDGLQAPLDHSQDPPQCKTLYGFWSGPWMAFRAQWIDFKARHDASGVRGWWQRAWGSLLETIDDYRRQLLDMRKAAEQAGYSFVGPSPQPPDTSLL